MMSLEAQNISKRRVILFGRGFLFVGPLAVALLAAPGCNQEGYPTDNTWHYQGKAPSGAPRTSSSFAYRYPDAAPTLDAAGLQDLVSKYRQRVVLLDFWASWSRETRDELAMLARLQSELKDEGFQVIACNFDSPDNWNSTTVPILHGSEANYPCVVISKSARPELRAWLSSEWSFDVPARFVISRGGKVTTTAFAGTPLGAIEQQVRALVRGGPASEHNSVAQGEVALRLKLVNVSAGKAESLGEVIAPTRDPNILAERAGALIADRLQRDSNPRIALAAFPTLPGRSAAGPMGTELATRVAASMRDKGYYDLIEPSRTNGMLKTAGQSVMSIEYEPGNLQGKLPADYLVIGWLRGDVGIADSTATLAGERSDAGDDPTP
jgi:thiol-disulfide isomerase/thioredoxin